MNPLKQGKIKITSRDIRPKQIECLKNDLMTLQMTTTSSSDTNEQFDEFHESLLNCLDIHCPIRTYSVKRNKFRREPWLTSGLLISCNKQKKLYKNSISVSSKPNLWKSINLHEYFKKT